MHGLDDMKLGAALMRDFGSDQRLGDDADHLSACFKGGVGDRAHQAKAPTAVDDADTSPRKGAANLAR